MPILQFSAYRSCGILFCPYINIRNPVLQSVSLFVSVWSSLCLSVSVSLSLCLCLCLCVYRCLFLYRRAVSVFISASVPVSVFTVVSVYNGKIWDIKSWSATFLADIVPLFVCPYNFIARGKKDLYIQDFYIP